MAYEEYLKEEARQLDGIYTGMCKPEEYQHLIDAGLLRKSFDGLGGFMGLSKLEVTFND